MPVTSTVSKVIYTGTGAVATYAFTFNVWAQTDLVLTTVAVDGTETTLALNSDYTVALSHAAPTPGTITLLAGNLANGVELVIQRILPLTQQINITDYSPTPAATWDEGLDRGRMIDQQLQEQVSRAILQPVNSTTPITTDDIISDAGAAAAASAAAALVSQNAAAVSAASALSNKNSTDADVILTHADVVLTHADVVSTHADVSTMNGVVAAGGIVKGDGTVNPTNLLINGDFESWSAGTSAAPDGWDFAGAGGSVAREGTIKKMGSYSAKITRAGTDAHIQFSQASVLGVALSKGIEYWKGRTVTLGCWVYATVAGRARVSLYDTADRYSSYHTGDSTWQFLTATITVSNSATTLVPCAYVDTGNTSAYFDGAMCVEGASAFAFSPKPIAYSDTRFKVLSFTRDLAAAAGDVAYTGFGFRPKGIVLFLGGENTDKLMSCGMTDGSTSGVIMADASNGNTTHNTILAEAVKSGSAFQAGSLKTIDADGFTMTWAKTGSPTGNAVMKVLAFS